MTLVEMLVVLAIVGVSAGVVVLASAGRRRGGADRGEPVRRPPAPGGRRSPDRRSPGTAFDGPGGYGFETGDTRAGRWANGTLCPGAWCWARASSHRSGRRCGARRPDAPGPQARLAGDLRRPERDVAPYRAGGSADAPGLRHGYSLMEAIVALFVLAIASTGLLVATQAHIDGVRGLEERVVAQWVAENRLVELTLGEISPDDVEMMGATWRVRTARTTTDDPDLQAVHIRVSRSGSASAAARLSGFVDTGAPHDPRSPEVACLLVQRRHPGRRRQPRPGAAR